MPIGPPSHKPEPKSGCSGEEAPMVLTQVEELGCTGSWSIRVFQISSAGRTVQFPMVGICADARLANPSSRPIGTIFLKETLLRGCQNSARGVSVPSGKHPRN